MNLPTEIVEMLGQTLAKVVPVTIALALVFSVLAHFWACNPGRPWWRKRELVTDVCYWFLVPLFARVFRIGLLVLGAALLFGIRDADELIAFYDNGHGPLSSLPLWLQAILFLVAAMDYFHQYRQWYERQKMSMRELKEEFKQSEGDPMIKGKIRQLRQQRMKKRMMAAVPKASVIITNPTHYSIALSYDRGMSAPVCVAKGADNIALKIREIAKKHDIPIVENVPLARALYATVDIDEEIPVEHYQAVAEIIGYVMGLKRGLAGRRM